MPGDFFDAVYRDAGRDEAAVPWHNAVSRELFDEWLADHDVSCYRRALVVASGLGDDAAALSRPGLEVVAFDRAPSAVEWARDRHAESGVVWHEADLFDAPDEWHHAFDLVIEVFTIQSIPPDQQPAAARAVRSFLAPGGTLLAIALVHDRSFTPQDAPWPLDPSTLDALAEGLVEVSHHRIDVGTAVSCVRVELRAEG